MRQRGRYIAAVAMLAGVIVAPPPQAGAEPSEVEPSEVEPSEVEPSEPDGWEEQAQAQTQLTTYENPVSGGLVHNPFVLQSDGIYYAYMSGFNFNVPFPVNVMVSTDMVEWTSTGSALPIDDAGAWADQSSGWNFNSPAVRHLPNNPSGSEFVMYFTGLHAVSGDKCIGVATAGSPGGPFIGADTPLVCPPGGAQDPSILAFDGLPFETMVYRDNGDGAIYRQLLSPDGQGIYPNISDPAVIYEPQPTWWHEGVVERPALVVDGVDVYLLFAAGPADTAERAMSWTPCRVYLGVVLDCFNETELGSWVGGTDDVSAPSGPQVFRDGDDWWLAYSARPGGACDSGTCQGNPHFHLDKLCFVQGFPRTNAPSTGPQELTRSPDCSDDVPGSGFVVSEVIDDGTVAPLVRDGNRSGAVGGRSMWVFGDTFNCSARDNSGAFGVPHPNATGPQWMADPGSCAVEAIPLTPAEQAFNAAHTDSRIIHWSNGLIGLPDGSGVVFFPHGINHRTNGWWGFESIGIGAARISAADVAAGNPTTNRDPAVSPVACNPASGDVRSAEGCLFEITDASNAFQFPLVDGDHLYMYSIDKVARAPLAQFETATWEYWTGPGPDDWGSDYDDATVIQNRGFMSGDDRWGNGGTVTYNPYVGQYVNYERILMELYVSVAPTPTGPWSPPEKLIPMAENICAEGGGAGAWTRTPSVHNELRMNGGRTLAFTYFRPGDDDVPGCDSQLRWVTVELE